MINEVARKKMRDLRFSGYFFDERYICTRDQIAAPKVSVFRLVSVKNLAFSNMSLQKSPTNTGYFLQKIDSPAELVHALVGVLALPASRLLNLTEEAKLELVVKTALISLIYVHEVRIDPQDSAKNEMVIIKPTFTPLDYMNYIWIVGELKYSHN